MTGVSLQLAAGQILGLVGENGDTATLLRVLATLEAPDRGRVWWFGLEDRYRPDVRARIGAALDTPAHYASLTGWQHASYIAALHGVARAQRDRRLGELFHWAGIEGVRDLRVRQYSLNLRRRLALVEALVHEPDLLILDQGTLGLDMDGDDRLHLLTRLRRLAAGGVAAVVTINRQVAGTVCHQLLELPGPKVPEPIFR